MLNLITIDECMMIVNINTITNNYKCIILTNIACTMLNLITVSVYRYVLHTGCQVVFVLRRIPQSCSCSSDEVSPQRNDRRQNARDEMAGNGR